MNKKYLIIGGVGVGIVALYYLLKKRGTSIGEKIETATSEAASQMSSLYTPNTTAPDASNYSSADQDYNDAVRRYQEKYKMQPDRSWTTSEIEARIANYDEIQKYIKMYYELEAAFDEGNTQKTEKELGRMNVSDLQALVMQIELQNKRTSWNQRKIYIEQVVNSFYENMKNPGTGASSATPYNLEVFRILTNLPQNEKVYANQYFGTLGGVKVGSTWGNLNNHASISTTIAGSIIPGNSNFFVDRDRAWRNGNNESGRKEALACSSALVEAYKGIGGTVNEYGEII